MTIQAYNKGKELNKTRLEELKNINSFDMPKFKAENPELEQLINFLIIGISKETKKKFETLTITEKEQVLINIFQEKEEEI